MCTLLGFDRKGRYGDVTRIELEDRWLLHARREEVRDRIQLITDIVHRIGDRRTSIEIQRDDRSVVLALRADMFEFVDPIETILQWLGDISLDICRTRSWVRGDDHDPCRIRLGHQLDGQA